MKFITSLFVGLLLVAACGKTASREDYDKSLASAKAQVELAQKNVLAKKEEISRAPEATRSRLGSELKKLEEALQEKQKAVADLEKQGPPMRGRLTRS